MCDAYKQYIYRCAILIDLKSLERLAVGLFAFFSCSLIFSQALWNNVITAEWTGLKHSHFCNYLQWLAVKAYACENLFSNATFLWVSSFVSVQPHTQCLTLVSYYSAIASLFDTNLMQPVIGCPTRFVSTCIFLYRSHYVPLALKSVDQFDTINPTGSVASVSSDILLRFVLLFCPAW